MTPRRVVAFPRLRILYTIGFLLLALFGAGSCNASAAPTAATPEIVTKGLTIAGSHGLLAAINYWSQFPPLAQNYPDVNRAHTVETITETEKGYGEPKSYSVLAIDELAADQETVWATVEYHRGVYYLRLQCYRVDGAWTLTEWSFNSNPYEILPAGLLPK